MNTPGGNAVSVAEHTLALMLAMARHIPQANASTRAGKWEKKKFMGNELRGKTLGIVGLGSIGREVVKRARAFEMRIVAHDPYVTSTIAHDLGVELLDLPKLYAASDYLTLHVASTPETQGMLSAEAFAQMKTGVRIVNCARGELVDEAALEAAIESGKVAGAALDVFHVEPPPADIRCSRAGNGAGDAAHRRLHRRGAGDRGRAHRRAGGGVSEERRRDQRGEHAGAVAGAVSRAGPVCRAGRPAGQFRGAHRLRQPAHGAAALLRQDRRQQHQPAAQRRPGGRAEPFHFAQGEPGERHADRRAARLERRRAARKRAPATPIRSGWSSKPITA